MFLWNKEKCGKYLGDILKNNRQYFVIFASIVTIAVALFEVASPPSSRKQWLTGGGANIEIQRVLKDIT